MSDSNTRKIPSSVKHTIYRILSEAFDFETPISMARVGSTLIEAGVDKSDFGYGSFKSFCLDIGDFLTVDEVVKGGVPQSIVMLHRKERLQKAVAEETPVEPAKPRKRVAVGGELENFAQIEPWKGFLTKLSGVALDEIWEFPDSDIPFEILDSYIRFTFYRLQLEDKVCIADNGQIAAFNTGLVDEHYDDVYACFKPAGGDAQGMAGQSWRFADFCKAGSRGLGKRLVAAFNPLPQPASYFQTLEDLLFDLDKELICDYQHMLLDNISRLPLDFLKEELRGSDRACSFIGNIIGEKDPDARARLYDKLADYLRAEERLFNRLRNRLADAVRLAQRQVRWNYRLAIPSYNPRTNSMCLLLPLCLTGDDRADLALVVTPVRSGNYQGQTILTLRQAYVDARLLCRISDNWLLVSRILDGS